MKSTRLFSKFILVFSLFSVLLCGCSYERSTQAGRILSVTMEEVQEKIDHKDTFILEYSQSFCKYCQEFKEEVLLEYLTDHELIVYNVVIDELDDRSLVDAFVEKHPTPDKFLTSDQFPTDILTPSFYFIEKGEVKEIWAGKLSIDELESYVTKYRLDAKK